MKGTGSAPETARTGPNRTPAASSRAARTRRWHTAWSPAPGSDCGRRARTPAASRPRPNVERLLHVAAFLMGGAVELIAAWPSTPGHTPAAWRARRCVDVPEFAAEIQRASLAPHERGVAARGGVGVGLIGDRHVVAIADRALLARPGRVAGDQQPAGGVARSDVQRPWSETGWSSPCWGQAPSGIAIDRPQTCRRRRSGSARGAMSGRNPAGACPSVKPKASGA